MVVFHSMGGLGNQLFQYATARRLAHELGVELAVDTSWHRRWTPNTTLRPFELPRLRVRLRCLARGERFWAGVARNRILGRLPVVSPWTVCRESGFSFDERVLRSKDRTYLYGYWQSPRYFEDVRDQLVDELQPIEPASEADREVLDAIRPCESVFVHVRRGDYVTLRAAAAMHGTCAPDYYRAAFTLLSRTVRDPVLFVFSDDPSWTRANVRFPAPTVYVDHNRDNAALQDLRLMAQCRHAIIANSSFSWWGAWLGSFEDGVVVAPKRWFADGRPTPGLFPRSWKLI